MKLPRWINKLLNDRFILLLSFSCYALAIIFMTTIGFASYHLNNIDRLGIWETFWYANNFIPFHTISYLILHANFNNALNQILGNIIMFVPLGFYFVQLFKVRSLKSVLLLGVCVSVGIELIQFAFNIWLGVSYRSVDVDDVILNTLGTGIGGYFILVMKRRFIRVETTS